MEKISNPEKFASMIISMSPEIQNEFFEKLKSELNEEDWLTVAKFISLWSMYNNPAKYKAMKKAIGDMLCEEIYGHTVEPQRKQADDLNLIYMHSHSIL